MAEIAVSSEPNNPRIRIFKVAIDSIIIGYKGRQTLYGSRLMLWSLADPIKVILKSISPAEHDVDINEHTRRIAITLRNGCWAETAEDAIIESIVNHIREQRPKEATITVTRLS